MPGPLTAARVAANLEAVRAQLPPHVQVLAATKYLEPADVGLLVAAGITLAGENRAQALADKAPAHPELTWDFIGALQSRKVRDILPLVRYVHSVCSDSVLKELAKHGTPQTKVLVQVNVAREEGKEGVDPGALPAFLDRAAGGPCSVVGLMTMPPATEHPEDSRRWFAALADLARAHDLPELSMGTTQDFVIAAQEGATIVRVGSRLYA